MFACINFGDENNVDFRLVSDYTVKCRSESHNLWTYFFGVPFLIALGVFFPCFVIFNMSWAYFKNKMQEKDRETLLKYGFFFYAYKRNFFFWDLIILIRKLFLLFISTFYITVVDINKDLTPILVVFLVLVMSVLIQYQFNPFDELKFNKINHVESVSLSSLVITSLATLIYFGETSVGRSINYKVVSVLVITTVVVNLFFLVYFFKAFYTHNIKVKLKKAKAQSEILLKKLKTLKQSIQTSSLWNSIARRFSSRNSSPGLSAKKITKAKSKPISLFQSNDEGICKKELFSPLKKVSKEQKKQQKKDLFVITEIFHEKFKEEIEKYNLLILEQRMLKQKLNKMSNAIKSEIDLGEIIPIERIESKSLLNSSNLNHFYDNKAHYFNACLFKTHLLSVNTFYNVNCTTKLKAEKLEDFYLKVKLEFEFKEEIDDFNFEMLKEDDDEEEGFFNLYLYLNKKRICCSYKPKKKKKNEDNGHKTILKIYLKSICIPITTPKLKVLAKLFLLY